jgi:tripartite-type tricarboxylate transporter receptor subunit TctC
MASVRAIFAGLLSFMASAAPSCAQSVADFYKGKTLTIVLGVDPGGTYDNSARLVSRFMGKYIPGNPNIVIQYMTGVNAVPAANYVYNIAPHDGTAIWAGTRLAPFEPLFGNPNARFDVSKLRWMGSTASEVGVVIAWHTAPVQTTADLFEKELIVGATIPSGDTYLYPNALNKLLGTKFKMVSGYSSQEPIGIAMEKGEVQGSGNWSWSGIPAFHPDWLSEKKIRVLMQLGLRKHPDLPDVPLVMDYARTDEQKQILSILMGMKQFGYPFFVPPGVPAERADALVKAFADTLHDPEFLAEAKKQKRDAGMATGEEMTKVVNAAYALPPALIQKARDVVAVQ